MSTSTVPPPKVVYAQKLLNRDLANISCASFREKNDAYLGCDEDGWIWRGGGGGGSKFRQVWIQGFVVEYNQTKDWLLIDDGTGTPWTVLNASKNPTTTKWLKDDSGAAFDESKQFYVQVLGEPVLLKDAKSSSSKSIHVAAIKVQNLSDRLPSFTLRDVIAAIDDAAAAAKDDDGEKRKSELRKMESSLARHRSSDEEKLQLVQWILEVDHMQMR